MRAVVGRANDEPSTRKEDLLDGDTVTLVPRDCTLVGGERDGTT